MSRAMSGNTVTGGTEGRQDQGAEAAVAMTQMGNGEIHPSKNKNGLYQEQGRIKRHFLQREEHQ